VYSVAVPVHDRTVMLNGRGIVGKRQASLDSDESAVYLAFGDLTFAMWL
jgi:hypothetical protein